MAERSAELFRRLTSVLHQGGRVEKTASSSEPEESPRVAYAFMEKVAELEIGRILADLASDKNFSMLLQAGFMKEAAEVAKPLVGEPIAEKIAAMSPEKALSLAKKALERYGWR